MAKIIDFVTLLKSERQLIQVQGDLESLGQMEIRSISPDREAKPGELAWISLKIFQQNPTRASQFEGSLLITPEIVNPAPSSAMILVCKTPKLAMIRVIESFFGHLAKIDWPKSHHQISTDAKIGENCVLSPGVIVGSKVILGLGVSVGPNTVLANVTIGHRVKIGANCTIGLPGFGYEKDANGQYHRFPHIGGVIIEEDVEIGSNTCIDRGSIGNTILHRGVKVDNLVHIAHNVRIGAHSMVIANSMIGGSTEIGEGVWVSPSASLMNKITINSRAVIGLGAVVLKDVENDAVVVGNPAKTLKIRTLESNNG